MTYTNPTIVFDKPCSVSVQDRELPIVQSHDVLIRTHHTLISTGTELTILRGEFPADSTWGRYGRFPFAPGYCHVGRIIACGDEVPTEWMGRLVASNGWHASCVTQRLEKLLPLPEGLAAEQATFYTIAQIVLNGVRRARIELGETAIVFGLGLLGQIAARLCRLSGARPVFAVDIADERLAMLPRDRAIVPINPQGREVFACVKEITGGRLCDVAFEVTGDPAQIPGQFGTLRRQGRLVVLSSPRGSTSLDLHDLCNAPSITIIGAHVSSTPAESTARPCRTRRRNAELFFDMLRDGEIDLSPLITHQAPYDRAPEIYRMLLADRSSAMGVVLNWPQD